MIRSWKTVLAAAALPVLLSSCAIATQSGNLVSESRSVSGFSAIELNGAGEVSIEQTGSESLTIEADEKFLSLLTSEVTDGTLRLGTKPNAMLINRDPVEYRVTVKDLTGLTITGSGNMTMPKVSTNELRSRISGSGTITVAGTADTQRVDISGSGSFRAAELATRTASVDISGSGDTVIQVSDSLDVRITGSGSVRYRGNPGITEHISGSGDLIKDQ
ncbi:MAG TPA: head GIN domain-containing protein [Propionibacteriaceae bacterium]|nr:head GIN domain-containing protein [Propionibacteriaceae bacterium]